MGRNDYNVTKIDIPDQKKKKRVRNPIGFDKPVLSIIQKFFLLLSNINNPY
jgi:hypothetical protein